MKSIPSVLRRLALIALLAFSAPWAVNTASAQEIRIVGTQRVDAETIRSYFAGTSSERINQAVRELYATGLFADVQVSRERGAIVVRVVENRLINRVAFEGNRQLRAAVLAGEVQSRARGAYNPATVEADVLRLEDVYRRAGRGDARITARTVELENGQLDVVFSVAEGGKTGVRSINFQGNEAISSWRLRNLMQTTTMNFLSWFKTTDVYDPERISADLEIIRRYYLRNGYADFRIIGSDARYSEEDRGWIIDITVEEGPQYRVGEVVIDSRIPDVEAADLRRALQLSQGQTYNGDRVERSVLELTRTAARRGYAFAVARPSGQRNQDARTIDLEFIMEEGPRVYVEEIVIAGNTRTRDYVIRREFDFAEGDAYNRVLVDRAERRLNNLGFFKTVRITNQPGSTPDRVRILVMVEDQPTGSFGVSGGYSTQDGIIAEVSLSESNFLGRGQFVRVSATMGQRTRGVDLSFTEPYLFGYRMSGGFDLFHRQTKNSRYSLFETTMTGGTLRVGIPLTEEISLGLRYSIFNTKITLPNTAQRPFNDCTFPIPGLTPVVGGGNPSPFPDPSLPGSTYTCMTNGEASLAIKEAVGSRLTSLAGVSLSYNTLDNAREPTSGLLAQVSVDVAGLGGKSRFLRTTGSLTYYYPVWDDVTFMAKAQAGHMIGLGGSQLRIIDNFNIGSSLVRGFAPGGLGPRDVSVGVDVNGSALGGTTYFGGTVELQFPIFGLPRELGLRGALFADAGTLFGYRGRTNFSTFLGLPAGSPCIPALVNASGLPYTQSNCLTVEDSRKIRSSAGVSVLWKSPMGPIRFDYAFVLSKQRNDRTQAFRFSGGGSF